MPGAKAPKRELTARTIAKGILLAMLILSITSTIFWVSCTAVALKGIDTAIKDVKRESFNIGADVIKAKVKEDQKKILDQANGIDINPLVMERPNERIEIPPIRHRLPVHVETKKADPVLSIGGKIPTPADRDNWIHIIKGNGQECWSHIETREKRCSN